MKEVCIRLLSNSYRDDAYAGNNTFVGPGVVVTSGSADYDVQGNVINDTRKFAANTQAVNYVDWIFATYVNGVPGANIFTNSFVKLREVVITYNAGQKFVRKTPFKAASISLTGKKSCFVYRCSVCGSGWVQWWSCRTGLS